MLKDNKVIATIAVKNLAIAKEFYQNKLALPVIEEEKDMYCAYQSGGGNLLVYKSAFAGGYKATVATWQVGNEIESIVEALAAKNVPFAHYDDLPGTTRKGNLHVSDNGMKTAWCTDPDGNILCFVSGR